MNVSVPLKFAVGAYTNAPVVVLKDDRVPLAGLVATVTEVIGVVPKSVSLLKTLPEMLVSSLPE